MDVIAEFRARQQIHDALYRYCRGVDRLDEELIRSAYHPGAVDSHGSYNGDIDGFVKWVFGNHAGKVLTCVHHIGNILITFESDSVAMSEAYVFAYHRRMVDGQLYDLSSHGRFCDRHEERGGEWRIVERQVVFDWDRFDPVTRTFEGPLTLELEKGRRDRDDASYRYLRPGSLNETGGR